MPPKPRAVSRRPIQKKRVGECHSPTHFENLTQCARITSGVRATLAGAWGPGRLQRARIVRCARNNNSVHVMSNLCDLQLRVPLRRRES